MSSCAAVLGLVIASSLSLILCPLSASALIVYDAVETTVQVKLLRATPQDLSLISDFDSFDALRPGAFVSRLSLASDRVIDGIFQGGAEEIRALANSVMFSALAEGSAAQIIPEAFSPSTEYEVIARAGALFRFTTSTPLRIDFAFDFIQDSGGIGQLINTQLSIRTYTDESFTSFIGPDRDSLFTPDSGALSQVLNPGSYHVIGTGAVRFSSLFDVLADGEGSHSFELSARRIVPVPTTLSLLIIGAALLSRRVQNRCRSATR